MTTIEKLQNRIAKTQDRYCESGGDREWENKNQIAIMEALIELLEVKNISSNSVLSDSLLAFNNELARYQDRLPEELKVKWNELLASNVR